MRHLSAAVVVVAGVAGLAQPLAAKVVKFEVLRVESPAFEGRSFGAVGTYDRIIVRATIAVSPNDPRNAVIVDIARAPRNAQGLVEATADVEILRPTLARLCIPAAPDRCGLCCFQQTDQFVERPDPIGDSCRQ